MGRMATRMKRQKSPAASRAASSARTTSKASNSVSSAKSTAKSSALRRKNPKASRKKDVPAPSKTSLKRSGGGSFRLSNFRTSLRNGLKGGAKVKLNGELKKKKKKKSGAGSKERSLVPVSGASSVAPLATSAASSADVMSSSTTTSTVLTVISTSTSNQQLSIVRTTYQHEQSVTVGGQHQQVQHVVDTIERVASGQKKEKTQKKSQTKEDDRSIRLRNRSVKMLPPPKAPTSPPAPHARQHRPKRRRLACLNALAKVHCLYENDFHRPALTDASSSRSSSRSSHSSSDSSSSSSSSSDSEEESPPATAQAPEKSKKSAKARAESPKRAPAKAPKAKAPPPKKKPAAKKPAARKSMEVAAVDLSQLVTPKRMASLNAAAILAASSQHWSDRPRSGRKRQSDSSDSSSSSGSESDDSSDDASNKQMVETVVTTVTQCHRNGKTTTETKTTKQTKKSVTSAPDPAASSSCGNQKSTKETTSKEEAAAKQSIRQKQHIKTENIRTVVQSSKTVAISSSSTASSSTAVRQLPANGVVDPPATFYPVAGSHTSYSPLGALYNMRPPSSEQQQQQQQQQHQQQQVAKEAEEKFSSTSAYLAPDEIKLTNHHLPSAEQRMTTTSSIPQPPEPSSSSVRHSPVHAHFGHTSTKSSSSKPESSQRSPTSLVVEPPHHPAFPASRLAPTFALYRPPLLTDRPPLVDPYATIPFFSPSPYPALDPAHYSPYYRGFALLPPPGPGFVPVALADSYAGYASLAGPSPAPPDLSYFYRYPGTAAAAAAAAAASCYPFGRYLPTAPCLSEWRRREPATGAAQTSPSSTMHGDRNPLPLAASEAATKSESANGVPGGGGGGSSSSSSGPGGHPLLITGAPPFCGFPPGPGMAVGPAFSDRCLSANCVCSPAQPSPSTCPKNVQAGPLTGEGKRSGPHPSQSTQAVTPHLSDHVTTLMAQPAGSATSSPVVPGLPPADLMDHPSSPLEAATDPPGDGSDSVNRKRRKRKSVLLESSSAVTDPAAEGQSPVSSRLRRRMGSVQNDSGCGLDCSRTSCCSLVSESSDGKHPDDCGSLLSADHVKSNGDSNGNHYTKISDGTASTADSSQSLMEERKRFGSDLLRVLADKISGRRKRKKEQLLNPRDLGILNQLNTSLTIVKTEELKKQLSMKANPQQRRPLTKADPQSLKGATKLSLKPGRRSESRASDVSVRPSKSSPRTKENESERPKSSLAALGSSSESKSAERASKSPQPSAATPNPPRWSNGWSWEGGSFQSMVHLRNDDQLVTRKCYPAMRHSQGDVVRVRDCILLKSGQKPKDLPFIAKVSALWENDDDGEMMMSLLWYYRPEHTEGGRRPTDLDDEIFASRHRDVCSVACIEDKCYVLTFNEYCRYRKQVKMNEVGLPLPSMSLVPSGGQDAEEEYPRRLRLPAVCTAAAPDRVFLCRKVYDFRQKRILKNPN